MEVHAWLQAQFVCCNAAASLGGGGGEGEKKEPSSPLKKKGQLARFLISIVFWWDRAWIYPGKQASKQLYCIMYGARTHGRKKEKKLHLILPNNIYSSFLSAENNLMGGKTNFLVQNFMGRSDRV